MSKKLSTVCGQLMNCVHCRAPPGCMSVRVAALAGCHRCRVAASVKTQNPPTTWYRDTVIARNCHITFHSSDIAVTSYYTCMWHHNHAMRLYHYIYKKDKPTWQSSLACLWKLKDLISHFISVAGSRHVCLLLGLIPTLHNKDTHDTAAVK